MVRSHVWSETFFPKLIFKNAKFQADSGQKFH